MTLRIKDPEAKSLKMSDSVAFLEKAMDELKDASMKMHQAVKANADAELALEEATKVYGAARDKAAEAVASMHLNANKVDS
jgi:hypothetical protein